MRSGISILLVGLIFVIATDTAFFLLIKKYLHRKAYIIGYWLTSLPFVAGILTYHLTIKGVRTPEAYHLFSILIGVLFLFYAPKLIYIIIGTIAWGTGLLKRSAGNVIRKIAVAGAVISFFVILFGITWGRYNFKVQTTSVCIQELPDSFNGLKIVQLTDIHLGSYGKNYKGIPKLVREVNELQPDLILFTGDMVNNFASEMPHWMAELSKLHAKYGKFAVTGNHDYGDYARWANPEDKKQNMDTFLQQMQEIGFHMLNNTNTPLVLNHDTLYIAGVENWGKPPFPRYGDLAQALQSIGDHPIILLSHDPSHWRAEVLNYPIALTLSGHTHAMQMGIQLGSWEWSPAKYIYPEYDGLYQEDSQYLYVSRGQGYLGFPGRLGLRPEISEIILKNDCKK